MAIYKRSYVFRLGSTPACYLWTGHGPLVTPADDVDIAGATWIGAGTIMKLPVLKALINGVAERVKFTLSGVNSETLRLALGDKDTVQNAEVRLGYVEFDKDWQLVGGVNWEWVGVADAILTESSANDKGRTRSISLSVASSDVTRSNPPLSLWTNAQQVRRSATDRFCDQVAQITLGTTRRFGPL